MNNSTGHTVSCEGSNWWGGSSWSNNTGASNNNWLSDNESRPATKLRVSLAEAVVVGIAMGAFIICTVVGNLLVILAVLTYRPLKTVQNYLIVSLAFSDCAVALVVMPLSTLDMLVEPWLLGAAVCDIWTTMDVFCCTASILNLCAIAVDRYFAIHDPISYACKRTARRMAIYIAFVYAFSICVSLPPLVGWKPTRTDWQCMLSDEKAYVIVSACVSFYFPCAAMCFIYGKIYVAARRRLRRRAALRECSTITASNAMSILRDSRRSRLLSDAPGRASALKLAMKSFKAAHNHPQTTTSTVPTQNDDRSVTIDSNEDSDAAPDMQSLPDRANDRANSQNAQCFVPSAHENHVRMFENDRQKISLTKERRAARTLGILMACFLLCWVPFFIYYVIAPWCESCRDLDRRIIVFVTWLGYANSLLNPPLYVGFSIEYRRAFRRLLHI